MSWYVGMGHDPEVPAGFQDADIEMAELREQAERMCRVCDGSGVVADNKEPGSRWMECRHCGGRGVME